MLLLHLIITDTRHGFLTWVQHPQGVSIINYFSMETNGVCAIKRGLSYLLCTHDQVERCEDELAVAVRVNPRVENRLEVVHVPASQSAGMISANPKWVESTETNKHGYIHTYIHGYIHTCIHTYMHTLKRKGGRMGGHQSFIDILSLPDLRGPLDLLVGFRV